MLESTLRGFYCPAGDFYVDPCQPVERAVLTHGHADHACPGCRHYLGAHEGRHVLRRRLGDEATIQTVDYGESVDVGGVKVSLHPAGHILGSAQVRLEHRGEVWVVSGDYKVEPDPTCSPFEPVRCHVFITESTFALPIFRWQPQATVLAEVNDWWRANQAAGRSSLLLAYALGKAQRLLAGVDPIGPIFTHGAVEKLTQDYRVSDIDLPPTTYAGDAPDNTDWSRALVVAPPSALGSPWMRRFGVVSTGFASGWMRVRGHRRQRAVDRGFVLSDHVDWPATLGAIEATGAEEIWVVHGYRDTLARWLREQRGLDAKAIETASAGRFQDRGAEDVSEPDP